MIRMALCLSAFLIVSNPLAYGQTSRPSTLEDRVAALEVENAKLRDTVRLLTARLDRLSVGGPTTGSATAVDTPVPVEEKLIGTWHNDKEPPFGVAWNMTLVIERHGGQLVIYNSSQTATAAAVKAHEQPRELSVDGMKLNIAGGAFSVFAYQRSSDTIAGPNGTFHRAGEKDQRK